MWSQYLTRTVIFILTTKSNLQEHSRNNITTAMLQIIEIKLKFIARLLLVFD